MQILWQDARHALRTLVKTPGFTLAAVVMLALGIGANTALFSVVKTVLLSSLPYRAPDRLLTLAANDSATLHATNVSWGEVQDWKERSHSFQTIAMFRGWSPALSGQGKPQTLRGMRVSYDFFETLGVSPALGRGFQEEEDRPDRRRVLLLSHGFWKEKFGGRKDVVGTTVYLNQTPFQIVGVLPENFEPLIFSFTARPPQVWAPVGYAAGESSACRSCQHLRGVARLQDGVTLAQARAEMNGIATNLAREFPKDYAADSSVLITPLHEAVVGQIRGALWLLLGATGFVLLIACANVANLLLGRAAIRQREMAVRAALGASRWRLVRHLLTESIVLTLAGGAGGIMLAVWGVGALAAWSPTEIPRLTEARVDASVLGFSLIVSIAIGLIAGLAPAFRAARTGERDVLQAGGRGMIGLSRSRLRALLVVSEVALAFVLTIGTGLLVRSLDRVLGVHPGFEPRHLFTANLALIGPKYAADPAVRQFDREALTRIRNLPGVEDAAIVSTLPLGGGFDRRGFHIQDRPMSSAADAPSVDGYFVSEGYFQTMGIPLRRGRLFIAADAAVAASAPVAIISESTAQQMWPGEDPLGKAIQLGGRHEEKPWATIVGIVGDVRQYGLDSATTADAYLLDAQEPLGYPTLVVRSKLAGGALARAIGEQISALDKDVPVSEAESMEQIISVSVARRRFVAALVGGFGTLALVLAAIGIYGVMAYQVAQRTGEIGIRMALGAQVRDVLGMILGGGAKLAAGGVGAGLLGALGMSRLLRSHLYEISPTDPPTFVAVALLLAIVVLLACCIPAWRAARVDPMVALRYE